MTHTKSREVKREKKKSLFLREITPIIQSLHSNQNLSADQRELVGQIFVTRIDLSDDTGICYVYFSTYNEPGEEIFNQALEVLKLCRKSIRVAFAKQLPHLRYTPSFTFLYDKTKEKERRVTQLLDKVSEQLAGLDKADGVGDD